MVKKISTWWSAHKPTKRRLIQVYAALLYNAHLKGFLEGEIYTGSIKNICVPGFNCYSCPGAIGACPLGALQNALASTGNRAPWYVFGIIMLYGLMLGRTICGWICPLGLIQELFYKIPVPKLKKSKFTRAFTWLKYIILAIFVIAIPLAYAQQRFPVPGFCKYICPAGTLEGAIGLLSNPANSDKFSMLGILFTRKFIIMAAIFTACIFIYRAFCRFLCPLGAIYGLFAKVSILGVKVDAPKCTGCGQCVAHCKMDVRHVGDHECIHCGACIEKCPAKAISLKCGKITLLSSASAGNGTDAEGKAKGAAHARRIAVWAVMLALLVGVICYVNQSNASEPAEEIAEAETTEAAEETSEPENSIPTGCEVGMRCPDFSVPLYSDGGTFCVSDAIGKPTIINFWATWCTPCVAELPYFQQLAETYGDQINLVAIHSSLITDDVQTFLDAEGLHIPFGQDDEAGSVIASLGGSTMLPMTVILDANGVIIYNQVGSVTYEKLEELVAPLLSES